MHIPFKKIPDGLLAEEKRACEEEGENWPTHLAILREFGLVTPNKDALEKVGPYFMGPHGEKYFFAHLCKRIHEEHPEVLGEHVSVQLEALGLLEAAQQGETPCQLPFTFADAA